METQAEAEDGQEEDIGAEIGIVAINGEFDGTVNADFGAIIC